MKSFRGWTLAEHCIAAVTLTLVCLVANAQGFALLGQSAPDFSVSTHYSCREVFPHVRLLCVSSYGEIGCDAPEAAGDATGMAAAEKGSFPDNGDSHFLGYHSVIGLIGFTH